MISPAEIWQVLGCWITKRYRKLYLIRNTRHLIRHWTIKQYLKRYTLSVYLLTFFYGFVIFHLLTVQKDKCRRFIHYPKTLRCYVRETLYIDKLNMNYFGKFILPYCIFFLFCTESVIPYPFAKYDILMKLQKKSLIHLFIQRLLFVKILRGVDKTGWNF